MPHIPTVACQARGQDQQEMGDNYFSGENLISLVHASQRPLGPFKSQRQVLRHKYLRSWENHVIIINSYLQYIYGYDSQTNSVFVRNCKE